MKFLRRNICVGILLLAFAAGCQVPAAAPPGPISTGNAAELAVVRQVHISAPLDLAWSAAGDALLVLQENGAVQLDAGTLQVTDRLEFEVPVMLTAIAGNGKLAFSEDGSQIQIKDIHNPEESSNIIPGELIGGLDLSPDGNMLLGSSMETWTVYVWDAASGQEQTRLEGFETASPVYAAQFGADGKHILWIARGTVQPMEIASSRLGPEIGHEDFVSGVALSPDSNVLATAAAGTVRGEFTPALYLWDVASGEALGILPYEIPFGWLAFSPDSQLVAASNGARITIWDATNPQLLAELDSGTDTIRALSFSPDGGTLATVSTDGTLLLWQVP